MPHFTVTVAVDVTGLLALRAELKAAGSGLTVTDFVHAATAQTLGEFPTSTPRPTATASGRATPSTSGVAVSVPAGLVVPVVRDADLLSVRDLHDRDGRRRGRGAEGTLAPDELTGSTFTVLEPGHVRRRGVQRDHQPGRGGHPGRLQRRAGAARPSATASAVRQVMRITLSADHRIVDGEMGARFLNAVRRRLEDAAAFRDQVPTG